MSAVTDIEVLSELNEQFIEAFRKGSWELLEPILTPAFTFLSGVTGEVQELPAYIEDLRANPLPALAIDQVVVRVDGDCAVVSARTTVDGTRFGRYLDSYRREAGGWRCFHACVWPVPTAA